MERYNESSDVRQLFRGAVQATKDEATRIADIRGSPRPSRRRAGNGFAAQRPLTEEQSVT